MLPFIMIVARRHRALFAISLAIGVAFTASCITRQADPLSFVPRSTAVLMRIHWPSVLQDAELARVIEAGRLREAWQSAGIRDYDIQEVLVFGELLTGGMQSAVVVRGRLDRKQIRSTLSAHGLQGRSDDGIERFDDTSSGNSMAIVGSSILLVGRLPAIDMALDTGNDRSKRLSANIVLQNITHRLRIAPERAVAGMLAVPEDSAAPLGVALEAAAGILKLLDLGPVATLVNRIGATRSITVGIAHRQKVWPVELSAQMKNEESASFIAGSLSVVKGIGALLESGPFPEPSASALSLREMSVSRVASTVTVRWTMPSLGLEK